MGSGGRARTLRNAIVTGKNIRVPTVVCVQVKDMKEARCLCVSDPKATSAQLVKYCAKRWSVQSNCRDTKDWRFGMGLSYVYIGSTDRRDRMLLLSAMAGDLLILLGAASENTGLDRLLKTNTTKKTHPLTVSPRLHAVPTPSGRLPRVMVNNFNGYYRSA